MKIRYNSIVMFLFIFFFQVINIYGQVYKTSYLKTFLKSNVLIIEKNIALKKNDLLNYNAGFALGYVNAIQDMIDAVNNMNLNIKIKCRSKSINRVFLYKKIIEYIDKNSNTLNQHPIIVVSNSLKKHQNNC